MQYSSAKKLRPTIVATAAAASLVFCVALVVSGTHASGDGSALPERASLADLQPETSIFLLSDLSFPDDGRQWLVRDDGQIRRVDLYQNGRRISWAELDRSLPYCKVLSRLPSGAFVEHTKRLQIAEVSPADYDSELGSSRESADRVAGVSIRLTSVQESAISHLICFAGSDRSTELTVAILKTSIGRFGGDDRLTLLAPLSPSARFNEARRAPARRYREALTEQPDTSNTARNLEESHREYLRYLKALSNTVPDPAPEAK